MSFNMCMLVSRCANRFVRLNTCRSLATILPPGEETAAKKKKKKEPEVRINLIDKTSLTVLSMEGALKLANKKGAQLTEVEKPAHWMLVGNRRAFELLAPGSKVASKKEVDIKSLGFKGLKTAIFGAVIQDHDINIKIKQLVKWSKSGYLVEVAIDVSERKDNIQARIEEALKDYVKLPGTVKRNSKSLFRIQYEPLQKLTDTQEETSRLSES